VHAGIYRALAAGYYDDAHVDLRVIQPSSTADTLRLIDAGKADFGIADPIDVASQIARGRDAKAVMALVQRPLGGLITLRRSRILSARQLEGKTVGVTGVPSDGAVLDAIVSRAGGDPRRVKRVTIGFNGVAALESGKIAAFTGFWPADGAQVRVDGLPTRIFRLDARGGPRYPGLVVFTTRQRIGRAPALVRAFVEATARGYQDTLDEPQRSLRDLLRANPEIKAPLAGFQLQEYVPLFGRRRSDIGRLDPAGLRALSAFLVRAGLLRSPVAPARLATTEFVPRSR
jgi:NitT/TauT family transport system substrate-binding protein/putative hydroxymethylpyrimidine transport system substrate-binding protein